MQLCKLTALRCPPYAAWLGSLEVKLLDKEIQSPRLSKKYGKGKFVPVQLCKLTALRCPPYAAWLGSLEVKLLDKVIQSPRLSKKYGKGKFVPVLN